MAESVDQFRRAATQIAIRQAIAASGVLPIGLQRSAVRSLVMFAGSMPMLRGKLRENMRLALGDNVPARAESLYFRHLGWFFSNLLPTYHRGLTGTPVPAEVKFDETLDVLDAAAAEGHGVVLASAHWSGHELVAAVINQRHPMTMLVRDAPTPERMSRKMKWYDALGAETVLRSSRSSSMKDAAAYLRVLKRGKLLALTPDLLADPGQGVEALLFGRPVRLHGGAFALAMAANAPVIRASFRWQSDSTVIVMFDRAPTTFDGSDRNAAVHAAVQDWCNWFEEKLRVHPENWLFWLDKRWSRFLHTTPRKAIAG